MPLLPDLGEDTKIEAAFATLQQMIAKGEATLIANLVARGVGDDKRVAESVEEVRYPTEFQGPDLPAEIPRGQARGFPQGVAGGEHHPHGFSDAEGGSQFGNLKRRFPGWRMDHGRRGAGTCASSAPGEI